SRALPSTFVADINITGLSQEEIIDKLQSKFSNTKINIISGETRTTTTIDSLGIEIDYLGTAERAITLLGNRSFFSIFNPTRKSIEIIANYDTAKARNLLSKNFANIEVSPTNAEVIWNAGKNIFEVVPSSRGLQLSANTITSRIVSFLSSIDSIDIYAEPIEVIPEIETPDADVIKDYLNKEVLGLDINIPPIANTHSANVIRSHASLALHNAEVSSHQDIARTATSALIRQSN
ncbi:peptidoglycan binding domain-containing protein, partial [Candidatus Saccharibacteria bacterium]|nr:peptidoglycan binding domain-containing protein [Candidatus Saccharibacteria bacterium]